LTALAFVLIIGRTERFHGGKRMARLSGAGAVKPKLAVSNGIAINAPPIVKQTFWARIP
jgi:hypothetical protein